MKTKTCTSKKNYTTHKPDITGAEWKPLEEIGQYKNESQLDRIERKLDELLARPYCQPTPVPRTWPVQQPPWSQQPHPPTDPYGNPVVYCSAVGGSR